MTTIRNMDGKKDWPRGVRFEPELWEAISADARRNRRKLIDHVRYLLECALESRGALPKSRSGLLSKPSGQRTKR